MVNLSLNSAIITKYPECCMIIGLKFSGDVISVPCFKVFPFSRLSFDAPKSVSEMVNFLHSWFSSYLCWMYMLINTLRTGDADLRF